MKSSSCLAIALAVLAMIALAPVSPVGSQSRVSSTPGQRAQYVIVVDDSGSMKQSDQDRLSIFAVRSLLHMLDDRDEVSLVRLNGPFEGVPLPPIEPLRANRSALLNLLAQEGAFSRYGAEHTRCASALAAVQKLLNAAYRPDARQVVLFLTDGACEPKPAEEVQVDALLQGIRSVETGDFQFYLLRFRGLPVSPALLQLAKRTQGDELEVTGADPASLLHPFAQALSRSQGYEAYLLSPGRVGLAAHRGAERVRLLAVASGDGPPLRFQIRDQNGVAPASVGQERSDKHRHGSGRIYRFTALDYRPGTAPVTVSVSGADDWQVIALPEYRLAVLGKVTAGRCDENGATVGSHVPPGAEVCVHVELVNAKGQVVGREVTEGGLRASVLIRRPDQPGGPPTEMAANPTTSGEARFSLPRSGLLQGDHEFQPVIHLELSHGTEITLRGRPIPLVAYAASIKPEPSAQDFGELRPGDHKLRPMSWAGSFPRSVGRLELADRAKLPPCVRVTLNGVAEGEPQPVEVGQSHQLGLQVAPYCGPRSLSQTFDTILRLRFDAKPGEDSLPTSEVPLRFALRYEIHAPERLSIPVKGGGQGVADVPISGNFRSPLLLTAEVGNPAEAWPEKRKHLTLGFPAGRGLLRDSEGQAALKQLWKVPVGGGQPGTLRLRAVAHRCCAGGRYETEISLRPSEAGQLSAEPLRIPVLVVVDPAGWWSCHGVWILLGLGVLLLLLLLLYLLGMWRHSRFLRSEQLSARLVPLVWTGYGDTVEHPGSKGEVERMVRRGLTLSGRVRAWLRANPFRFGLPGGLYSETVELFLQPHRDLARSQVALVAEPGLAQRAEREPGAYAGRLFASATGGTTFFGAADSNGRISRMVRNEGGPFDAASSENRPRVVKLRRVKLVQPLESWEKRDEGAAAGWQVG